MRSALIVGALLLTGAGYASGQSTRYQPSPDTLRFQSLNSYLMYFVRGTDTLGEPVSTTTRESRHLRTVAGGLELWTRLEGEGFSAQESYTLTPEGRVIAVGGKPVGDAPNARVDVLPRLAIGGRAMNVGTQWSDTVSVRRTQSYGLTYYDVARNYRVIRTVDTLDTKLALLVANGQMKLRQGGWQDSAQGVAWWQEVRGPVTDTVWFDTRAGNIHQTFTIMNLVGTGGYGPLAGGVTMPSGLRSSVRMTRRK
jgi:hypothetical protein